MAIITDKTGEPSLKETLIALILEVNAALWYVRKDQNTGDGSSPGIQVLLPEQIDVEVVFGADGAINSVTRTQDQTTTGTSSTTQTTRQPEKVTETESTATKDAVGITEVSTEIKSPSSVSTTANEAGGDSTKVSREYKEPG
jgi:hypothetical protein|tara:strand:- start:388 stop:813 length:426 start_codon:yes stop_codon:yes gene_type:complete